ncbi:MAG: metallophosphoesterase, partial [Prolixibacteraceae bacterium]|nr:metallophosphoesterase [Prolixibacteraceae bacterium]
FYSMRSFQVLMLLFFIFIYIFISFSAISSLKRVVVKTKKNIVSKVLWSSTLLIFASFVLLYIWPFSTRDANGYAIYFIFNAVLFLDFFFKLPLMLVLPFQWLLRKTSAAKVAGLIALILSINIGLIIIYGSFFGNKKLKITAIELHFADLPESFDGFRIIQISDIHLGSFVTSGKLLHKLQPKIENLSPDLILFTGDLVNNFAVETQKWIDTFKKINSKGISYSILGNHDYGDYSRWKSRELKNDNFKDIVNAHLKMGFHILRNESVKLMREGDSIFLVGVENWGHPPFPQYANLDSALRHVPNNGFKILLSHDPAHWESKIRGKKNIQLTLSGHTHGLQWGIKLAGIPFSLAYLIRKNWGGLYKSKNTYLYVNTGLGTIGIPWRIDMPAEITLLTLKRGKIDRE